jgi:iron complex outermembrane recepter protein
MRRILLAFLVLLLAIPAGLQAQSQVLTGQVTGPDGQPVRGAVVRERGTSNQTVTDARGRYSLLLSGAGAVIRVSAAGHLSREVATPADGSLDVALGDAVALEGVVVVGSRRVARSSTETPVAVDVIPVSEVAQRSGQLDLNQLLQVVAPSFNANRQSGADGSDHIDPATLRGLGPDQTLVLVNGKRRHQSALINIFGSRGRGNTGTDLNAIPVAAIERIEILREGASSQYGSDAIAGVINIVLKESTDELTASLASGVHNARPPSRYAVLRDRDFDGRQLQAAANYGVGIGAGGFLNMTAELFTREKTNRPADPASFDIYRRQFGDASGDNFALFLNSELPVSGRSSVYGFGGLNLRRSDAYAWTREPDSERNVPEIYPNGFDPRIQSDVTDGSASVGYRGEVAGWTLDVNNTFGYNRMHYTVDGTVNASLGRSSPTRFDAGGFQFGQNTAGAGVTRLFPGVMTGMNVAFGAEFRVDRYEIFAGEEGSYRNYSPAGSEDAPPGGSQGFPGFQPDNELSEMRTNVGAYADVELDVTPGLTLAAAARVERYSDFGSTLTGRLSGRLALAPGIALRASLGTGFRAPSLAQIHFNSTFTDFVGGEAVDKLIARNDDELTRALGIPALREERSRQASVGLTARRGAFTATADAYVVNIDDRIVLTGAFEDTDPDIGQELRRLGVGAAQFFTNALDTETRGLDLVLAYARQLGSHTLRASLAGNFNEMELGAIHTSAALSGKEDIYFGPREQAFLVASAPGSRITLGLDHGWNRVATTARVNRFGRVTLIDWIDEEDVYEPAVTLDASVNYRLSRTTSVTLGGTNLLNRYPTQQDTETETGGLWDAVQMGSSGAFYFVRLNIHR